MVCAPLLAASRTVSVTGPPCVPQRARKPTVFDGRKPWRIHDGLHTLGSQNRQGAQAMSRRGAPHPPPVQHAPYRETCTRQPALVRHSEARVDPQPEHHGGGEVPDLRSRARPPRGMGPAAVPPLPPRPRRPPRGGGACRLARTAPREPPAATGPRGARRPAAGRSWSIRRRLWARRCVRRRETGARDRPRTVALSATASACGTSMPTRTARMERS